MTELIAVLSTGKGTWAEVVKIMNTHDWEHIYLVTDDFGSKNFNKKDNTEFVVINANESVELVIDHIVTQLRGKIGGTEVALNLTSGTGKEHMALLSALLKLGLGVRLVTATVNGIKEI
jgi:hypothetical protein